MTVTQKHVRIYRFIFLDLSFYLFGLLSMILMIDNYCSFTYNIVQYCEQLQQDVVVKYNTQISLSDITNLKPKAIILGPGPCTPSQAGITLPILQHIKDTPILGICLGHQAIGQAFGGQVIQTKTMHGRVSAIYHNQHSVFTKLPTPFLATRYHSLVIDKTTLPSVLAVSAWTQNDNLAHNNLLHSNLLHSNLPNNSLANDNWSSGEIMGVYHRFLPIHGVQFHPESILSEQGFALLNNFLVMYGLSSLSQDQLPVVA